MQATARDADTQMMLYPKSTQGNEEAFSGFSEDELEHYPNITQLAATEDPIEKHRRNKSHGIGMRKTT